MMEMSKLPPEPKLPPIMVRNCGKLKTVVADISKNFENKIRIKLAGEHIKIFPGDSDQHRDITKYLALNKLEYFVITPKSLRPLKAVLKGIPIDYTEAEIQEALEEAGFQIDKVRQLTNLKTKAPIPVWQLTYLRSDDNKNLCEGGSEQTPAVLSTTENQHNNNNNTINNDDNVNDTSKMLYVLTEMKNVFNMFGGLSNIYAKLRNANNL
ncbi:RNA-directed DNA polymerase from mobile element jockey [Caerostris extrusa]|uniref:RNA-directed DNA polymerase from mobile element jockey n=1 Tax=Caerostris extrusa TaxID=172846 RepID=A0AAV4NTH1_CAEEX|nr:RNA-directed DNA polymerase from mobile element jockey [Caerostris extrusa]